MYLHSANTHYIRDKPAFSTPRPRYMSLVSPLKPLWELNSDLRSTLQLCQAVDAR